jgi:methyltransferase (TIGR00027 family)
MAPASVGDRGPSLAARTKFFDERVLDGIGAGVGQVVILGAGYDDRALRFPSPGVRFFEVDHPATQADKARRLRAMRPGPAAPTLAPADFRHDDLGQVLAACGHDATQPTLFLCEALLAALRARAATGSILAASLSVHREGLDSARVTAVANARRAAGRTEPWLTILPAPVHLALLRQSGWSPATQVDAAEIDAAITPGRSLLVTARPTNPNPDQGASE